MVRVSSVSKVYNEGKPNSFQALRDIDLDIRTGAVTILNGPSGSGKTTLLSVIGCMTRPTTGRVFLDEREISGLPERVLSEIRRNKFGFVFQNYNLIPGLSSLDNIVLPAFPSGERYGRIAKRARGLMERFRILPKEKQPVESLSGGEKQRVAMVRALINSPEIIIADEPTAHLDSELAGEFLAMAADLRAEGKTVIMASHDPLIIESDVVDESFALRDGGIVGDGPP